MPRESVLTPREHPLPVLACSKGLTFLPVHWDTFQLEANFLGRAKGKRKSYPRSQRKIILSKNQARELLRQVSSVQILRWMN